MANPNYLWVRDAVSEDADTASPGGLQFDLLWKARTGRTAQGSDAALGQVQQGDPRLLFDRPLAPQDVSGALVKRIFISYSVVFAPIPSLLIAGTNADRWSRLGFYEGVLVANAGLGGISHRTSAYVGAEDQSVTVDWMHWNRRFAYTNTHQGSLSAVNLPIEPVAAGENILLVADKLDIKAQRRLKEWDDTVVAIFEPSEGETMNHFSCSWSVLLELPH